MIKVYETCGPKRVKVFFKIRDNVVTSVVIGNRSVITHKGYQFYVDDYVAEQIDKCELFMDGLSPSLRVKDGEEIEVPEKTEREKRIERLEFELEQERNAE